MEDFPHPYLTFFAKKAAKTLRDMYDFFKRKSVYWLQKNCLNDYKSYTDIHNLPAKYRYPGSVNI